MRQSTVWWPKLSQRSCFNLLVIGIIGLLVGCSFDYGENVTVSKISKSIPDMQLNNVRHAVIRDGLVLLSLKAQSIQVFTAGNQRVFSQVSFFQYDKDGNLVAEGTAGSAKQAIDTENIDFSDGIEIVAHNEKALIRAEGIGWNAKTKVFSSRGSDEILVRRGDSTELRGTGLSIDTVSRIIEFNGAVQGVLSDNTDNANRATTP